jgi:hypothetical protein
MELLKVWICQQEGINCLMESCPFLLGRRDGAARKVFPDKGIPLGEFFIASIQSKVYGETDGAIDVITGDGIMRQGIGVVAMVVMAVHIVEETAHMLAQGVIEYQRGVGLRTADCFGLLKQIFQPTVIDAVVEPWRFGEEAGEIGFVGALEHTAGHVGEAFVVQDDQSRQVVLEMLKLAPILKEIAKDLRMGGHDGSGGHDGKLHQAFTLVMEWEAVEHLKVSGWDQKSQITTVE